YLLSKYPNAKIVGEETGGSTAHDSFWIIDPIDGTRMYARGINTWAVLISRYDKNEFKVGVCYFPCLNEMYYAEKGKGAYLNKKRLNVSQTKPLGNALINSGNPQYYKNKQIVIELLEESAVVRGYETTYADCLVAAGKMDASIDNYAQLWDFAAFAVIIPEAGGKITNYQGKPLSIKDRGFIASNGIIHDELLKIVKKYL
ncbi:MAG TPA: inositol monophosphatase, partial [Xanthomonadales bacterium]|nr:inositol monophosphatase [Xanthomonadales bacterium]